MVEKYNIRTDLALEAAQMQAKTARLTSRPGMEVRRR